MPIDLTKPIRDPDAPKPADQVRRESTAKDTPPRSSGQPRRPGRPARADTLKAETAAIQKALEQVLAIPAIPAAMMGEAYLAEHFSGEAPTNFARELAKASEGNQGLRTILLRLTQGEAIGVLLFAGFAYLMPPVMYLATADDHPARKILGVPKRHPDKAPGSKGTPDFRHPNGGGDEPLATSSPSPGPTQTRATP